MSHNRDEAKANWASWLKTLPFPEKVKARPDPDWRMSRCFELGTSTLTLTAQKLGSFSFSPAWTPEEKVFVEVKSNDYSIYRAMLSTRGVQKKLPELLDLMVTHEKATKVTKLAREKLEVLYTEMETMLRDAGFEVDCSLGMGGELRERTRWDLQRNYLTAELLLTCTQYPISFAVPISAGRTLTDVDFDELRKREAQLQELAKSLAALSKPLEVTP